ncbi:hypothetical protein PHMEG_00024698, partial [Phytophthora megakarya]
PYFCLYPLIANLALCRSISPFSFRFTTRTHSEVRIFTVLLLVDFGRCTNSHVLFSSKDSYSAFMARFHSAACSDARASFTEVGFTKSHTVAIIIHCISDFDSRKLFGLNRIGGRRTRRDRRNCLSDVEMLGFDVLPPFPVVDVLPPILGIDVIPFTSLVSFCLTTQDPESLSLLLPSFLELWSSLLPLSLSLNCSAISSSVS